VAEEDPNGNGGRREAVGTQEERDRLINAFTRLAAEQGYSKTSIDEVSASAGLPPTSFFEYFDSKAQLLEAAHDAFFERLAEQAKDACRGEETWPAGVKAAVTATFEFLLETASRARLFMVEASAGGVPLFERKLALTRRFADLLEEGRTRVLPPADLPASTEWILVGGALARISEVLLAEEPGALVDLEPEVVELILMPYVGPEEARRAAGI